jgi:hypothetical protein
MNATYHCKRSLAFLGAASMVGGLAFIGMLCLALQEPSSPNAPPYALVLLAVVSSFPIVLLDVGGAFCLLVANRHRLTIAGESVESLGIFGAKQINLAHVSEARWRIYGTGGGRLVLKGPTCKLTIDFSAYPKEHSRQLIRFFRFRLRQSNQQEWEKYWRRHWRFFDDPDPALHEQFVAETRALRWRLVAWIVLGMSIGLPIAGALFFYAGKSVELWKLPVVLIPIAAFFAYVVVNVRADRNRIADRFVVRPKANALLVLAGVIFVLTWILAITLALFDAPGGKSVFVSGVVLTTILLYGWVIHQTRAMERAKVEAAKAAEGEYMRPLNPPPS